MFLWRVFVAFGFEHLQAGREFAGGGNRQSWA
jgi:hypothetical protein